MLSYRAANIADIPVLAHLRSQVWGAEPYWQERIEGYMSGTRNPNQALAPRMVFVAEEEGKIVGLIAGHLTRRYDCDGELQWIDVVLDARRRGVGSGLLRTMAAWFAGQGVKKVCVDVEPENTGARAFYQCHGAGRLNDHWLVWEDMPLQLPAFSATGSG